MRTIPLRQKKIAIYISLALMYTALQAPAAHADIFEYNNVLYYSGSGNPNGNGRDYTNYEEVRVRTEAEGTVAPLAGWAIYLNDGSTYKFNDLTVNTSGTAADGIHTKAGGGFVVIQNYQSETTGSSADGINLGRELNSGINRAEVTINGDANIIASGMGIRANASSENENAKSTITINGNADITTTTNGGGDSGYAVFAGQDTGVAAIFKTAKGKAEVYLNGDSKIKTTGNNAHGVYARGLGMISLGNVDISTTGNTANGLYASSTTANKLAEIYLSGDADITVGTGSAIYATGASAIIKSHDVSTSTDVSGIYNINGNILSASKALVSLNMANGSQFVGVTDSKLGSSTAGTLNLSMDGESSVWEMTGNSNLTSLTLDNGSTLRYGAVADINTADFVLGAGGGAVDTNGFDNTLDELITGSGSLSKTGEGTLMLTGINEYAGGTNVEKGTLQLDATTTTSQINLSSGAANIALEATLAALADGEFTFNNVLTGEGTLRASNQGEAFHFSSDVGSDFKGTVALANNTFALTGDNTAALTQATLQLDAGNITTVGDGTAADSHQHIGGLTFNGGKAIFNADAPADKTAVSVITADKLDISGTGTVQVNVPAEFNNTQPIPDSRLPLLEQDDQGAGVKLVNANSVTGTGGSIQLVDQNGDAISDARTLDLSQNGVKVAEGTYDFGLTAGAASDGLYVNYGLQQVNLLGSGDEALVLTPADGATGAATDLAAKVIGVGDLAIAAGTGQQVSLSNGSNRYTGETDVRSGTLVMANNNVLGQTSALNLAEGTAADMQGHSQSIGALNTAAGSLMTLSGSLTITESQRTTGDTFGGAIETGTLAGDGALTIDPGVVMVNGDQTAYTGEITLKGVPNSN